MSTPKTKTSRAVMLQVKEGIIMLGWPGQKLSVDDLTGMIDALLRRSCRNCGRAGQHEHCRDCTGIRTDHWRPRTKGAK